MTAWTADNCGGAEGLIHRLSGAQLEAIDAAVHATEGLEPTEVTASDFGGTTLDPLMTAARYELVHGKGVVLLSGVDLGRYSLDQFKRLYFGLGAHIGTACEQSPRHDRIGLVRKEPNPDRRGYLTDTELGPHTDYHEAMSLASVVTSEEGGVSGFVSSEAVVEVLRAERPDYLPVLMEGWYYPTSATSVTEYKVPTISVVDGETSLFNYVIFPFQAAEILGRPVPTELVEAWRYLAGIARRPELRVTFTMQPGEMAFWYNFKVMHSRTAFRNSPGRERMLLRLWLQAHDKRPMARGFHEMSLLLDNLHAQGQSILVNSDASLKAVYEAMSAG